MRRNPTLLAIFATSIYTVPACSSSSSSGGGTDESDSGAPTTRSDGGSSVSSDAGSAVDDSGTSSTTGTCPTGSFACGSTTCDLATEYCSPLGCAEWDPEATPGLTCPSCTEPQGECGVGKTLSCSGTTATGITISCN